MEKKIHAIRYFPAGIICGPHRGSFAVGDHLRFNLGIISGLWIICGRGSFAALYRPEPRREKRESCISCRRMLGTTPFLAYLEDIPNLGIAYSRYFYTENMAGNLKGNYDAKFLEAIGFAFKKCQFNFVPKAEQVQAIHAVVTGNDV